MHVHIATRTVLAGLSMLLLVACAPGWRYQAAGPQGGDYYHGLSAQRFIVVDESPLRLYPAYFSLFWGINRYAYHPFFHPGFHYGISLYPRHYMALSIQHGRGHFGPAWRPALWYAGYYRPWPSAPWRPGWNPAQDPHSVASWRARDEASRLARPLEPAVPSLLASMPAARGSIAHGRATTPIAASTARELASQGVWAPSEPVLPLRRATRAWPWVEDWSGDGRVLGGSTQWGAVRTRGEGGSGAARGVPDRASRGTVGVSAAPQRVARPATVPPREPSRQQER